jgi:hypothetical protein
MKRTKRCPKCGIEKPLDAFSRARSSRDGLQVQCKPCRQVITKAWREKNPDQIKRYNDQYRETHRERRREYDRHWRQENRNYWRDYQNDRLHGDLSYRLHNYISRAIRRAIKKDRRSAFDLLGYTVEELRQHLESLFQPGMTWENYGTEWHIDHITPKSWFKLENEDGVDNYELRLCWSLRNLQPMWGVENLEKSNRYISDIKLGKIHISYDEFRRIVESQRQDGSH